MLKTLLKLAALGLGVHAFPPSGSPHDHGVEPAGHEWMKPGPSDSRSPCPGLHSLANHNFLLRSGKNITYPMLRDAAMGAYKYTEDTTQDIFNLEDMKAHNTIEQGGSLSRNDYALGDDVHFSSAVWDPVAKDLKLKDLADGLYVSNSTAARAYQKRQKVAQAANPDFTYDYCQRNGTRGTTSLYLATLWDYKAKAARKSWIDVLLQ